MTRPLRLEFEGALYHITSRCDRREPSWTNMAAGSYTLTAKATDNNNGVTTSAPITVTVNAPPTVSLTGPANNATFVAPASIALSATATDTDGTITQVQFFNGATLIGASTAAPYTFNWTAVPPGTYSITARATDNNNATSTSAPVTVTVNANTAPTVTLTSPGNNASYTAPASISLSANAADTDGTITQVQFLANGNPIGTVTNAPYTATWAAVPAGTYVFTAVATDHGGLTTVSAAVTVTVNAAAPAGLYFIHPDHLNTPRLITNASGTPVWRWDNDDPFGNNTPNENPNGAGQFTCNLRLPGQYFDRETNLHYNYFRDYDPAIGRYVQSDPIGLRGGINTYAYVHGNPLSYTDPTGEIVPIVVVAAAIKGAAAGAAINAGIQIAANVLSQVKNADSFFDPNIYFNALKCVDLTGVAIGAALGATGLPGFGAAAGAVSQGIGGTITWSAARKVLGEYGLGAVTGVAWNKALPDVPAGSVTANPCDCANMGIGGALGSLKGLFF